MNHFLKLISLLKRYFRMYWLKPFDAVNDAANAIALLQFNWSKKPILEIGGGDGIFSFIMHDGEFKFLDDRYGQVDPSKSGDIYDVYKGDLSLKIKRLPLFQYDVGIDLKLSHLLKSKETGLYKHNNLISSKPEALPFKNNTFSTIFLYIFHGLTDYKESLKEIRRATREDGILLMIVMNEVVREHFICFKIHKFCKRMRWSKLSEYFLNLDGGRYEEISGIFAKSIEEWRTLCYESGFQIKELYTQVSPLLWRIYDTQTRPFLKLFIRLSRLFEKFYLKAIMKCLWIFLWFPFLLFSYLVLARPIRIGINDGSKNIFIAIKAKPV